VRFGLCGEIVFGWWDELEQGDGAFGEERFEPMAAGGLAVHVLDHHAGGFERPCLFDRQREGERARELVVGGWLVWAQRDAHGLDGFAACDLEERRFGLRCGVAREQLGHAPADQPGFECFC
jgi:hypothetical protein